MTGVIVLNKPKDFTSFDAVALARKILKEKKIGHTGTLDPMATGVLPLLIGRGTKAADLLPDTNKSYRAEFTFGKTSDTLDITGKILGEDNVPVTKEMLMNILPNFTGDIMQIPPMYSAVSVGGKRLYELARQGIEIEREARKINISQLEILSYNEKTRSGSMLISCSKGTYIRTLIDDMGKALGSCGGIMTALNREYACGFSLEDAITFDELRKLAENGDFSPVLRPLYKLFPDYIRVTVSEAQEKRFLCGGELGLERLKLPKIALYENMPISVFGQGEENFLGLGKINLEKNELKILKLLK